MNDFLGELRAIAIDAGKTILDIYHTAFEAREKADGSAVTDADEAAENLICARLRALQPDTPILAEEAACQGTIPDLGTRFFLVDPLDGTREFVNRTDEFTVNIALIEAGRPKAGVVLAPALGKAWLGETGTGAFLQHLKNGGTEADGAATPIAVRAKPGDGLIAVASRSHRSAETEALLDHLGVTEFQPAGSSLKFCLVAEGRADVYPRLGRTMEWDTGAGQAVLEAAGGRVHELNGQEEGPPLSYGKVARGYDNPHFIAWGG